MDSITILLFLAIGWMLAFIITRGSGYKVRNPEIGLGFALFRTTRLNNFISKITEKGRRFWKGFFDIGVVASIGIMLVGLILLTFNLPAFFFKEEESPAVGVAPVIPGITVSFSSLPYFIIAIAIGAAVHELCHGIAALNEKIPLKSTGIFLFLLFFGAFVEPKEEELKNSSRRSRLRIYAAGGLANLIVTYLFIIILILPFFFSLAIGWGYKTDSSGVLITEVVEDSPADKVGIGTDWIIKKVAAPNQSQTIFSIQDTQDLRDALSNVKINDSVQLWFKEHEPVFLIAKKLDKDDDSDKGYIGIRSFNFYEPILPLPLSLPYHMYMVLVYIVFINLMLALFNLLPIPFLDGDRIVETLLEGKGEKGVVIHKWIRISALSILLLNMLLTFVTGGWVIQA